jgi:hypothetical protein
MNTELITALLRRTASASVGPSTARNMGLRGTVGAARDYLASLDIRKFDKKTEKEFLTSLNTATVAFVKYLPLGAKWWGSARKFLNIFLREVIYNRFLCEHYNLYRIEPWLELPLDSHVAKGLRKESGGHSLSRWKTVIRLDSESSHQYQELAAKVAKTKNIHRVHLDVLYWRPEYVTPNRFVPPDAGKPPC